VLYCLIVVAIPGVILIDVIADELDHRPAVKLANAELVPETLFSVTESTEYDLLFEPA